jgi:anti-sigma factor RsiW
VDVPALVLGHMDAPERAAMARHLLGCRTCRDEYEEMIVTVADLLPAVPAVQPPLGFDQRVLSRMGVATPQRRRVDRRWVLAAAAAVLLVVGIGAAVLLRSNRQYEALAVDRVAALDLTSGSGTVGTVSIGKVDGDRTAVVTLVNAPDGVSYRCRMTYTDGTTTESEAWPPGNGVWLVPLPDGATVRDVQIVVDDTGAVWSSATFS